MPRLRQLPQLYLRGSIANETMKNLPPQERQEISGLVEKLTDSPLLAGHKHEFISQLGRTIGCDYREDSSTAIAEYQIAIWRALIYLRYHSDYAYQCENCKATEYKTHQQSMKTFDRRYPTCPNCSKVKIILGSGQFKNNSFAYFEEVQNHIRSNPDRTIKHTSPIVAAKGKAKITNWQEILNDPNQLYKFFGEFIWNYFRQHLRENEIRLHKAEPTIISGPADLIAAEEIVSLLKKNKIEYNYQKAANPYNGYYTVGVRLLVTHKNISDQLRCILNKYRLLNIQIIISENEIKIGQSNCATNTTASITSPQEVFVQTERIKANDDDVSIYEIVYDKVKLGGHMQEDGIAEIESEDLVAVIRKSLPDGARNILDIITGNGEMYQKFSVYIERQSTKDREILDKSHRLPSHLHMAKFLRVSNRQVNQWLSDIRIQCLAHNLANHDLD